MRRDIDTTFLPQRRGGKINYTFFVSLLLSVNYYK